MGNRKVNVGDVFYPKEGGECEVVKYNNSYDVEVRFKDSGYVKSFQSSHIIRGLISDPNHPRLLGVGYLGVGKYSYKEHKEAYIAWRGAIVRGHCNIYKKKRLTYKDCYVCDEWHNFQVFADWYCNHESYGLGYHLDKDLLVKGNKVYSPDTCTMIPNHLNKLIGDNYKKDGDLPLGVTVSGKKYKARLNHRDGNIYLGVFENAGNAANAYAKAKESLVRKETEKLKGTIDKRAFESLRNWRLLPETN